MQVHPGTDDTVYQCKWEIDSLASFLRLSWGYWESTGGDKSIITDDWLNAVKQIMKVLQQQSLPTLATDGSINPQAYSYQPVGSRAVCPHNFLLIADGPIATRGIRLAVSACRIDPICLSSIRRLDHFSTLYPSKCSIICKPAAPFRHPQSNRQPSHHRSTGSEYESNHPLCNIRARHHKLDERPIIRL